MAVRQRRFVAVLQSEAQPEVVRFEKKLVNLRQRLRELENVAIAFSGGVDSTFLLAAAGSAGLKNVTAITVSSAFVPEAEIKTAVRLAEKLNVRHIVIEVDILGNEKLMSNPKDRCYHCKYHIFSRILKVCREQQIPHLLHGINTDDLADYRPGIKAADELGVLSPLVKAGFSKARIRAMARSMGLENWDKPAQSCLATRLPYGEPITKMKLMRIEKAENYIRDLGFEQVRVRMVSRTARIEVEPDRIEQIMKASVHKKIADFLISSGFQTVSVDPHGYRTGAMNHEIFTGKNRPDLCPET